MRGRWVRRAALVVVAGGLGVLASCGRPATAPERAEVSQAPAAPPGEARVAEARALAELKALARRRLAADRAAVQNRLGYEQALARQRRDAEATGMNVRIPTDPVDASLVEAALAAPIRETGGRLRDVRVGVSGAAKAVPATWEVEGPYPFESDQLVMRLPLAVEVEAADDAVLTRVFEVLRRAEGPLLDVDALRIEGESAIFVGAVYQRREVSPPKHGVASPEVAALAQTAGVALPKDPAALAEVEALLDEDRALATDLGEAIATLSLLDLESRVFQFYRQRAKAVASRGFADLTRASP